MVTQRGRRTSGKDTAPGPGGYGSVLGYHEPNTGRQDWVGLIFQESSDKSYIHED